MTLFFLRSKGSSDAGTTGLTVTIINGQPMLTLVDTTRLVGSPQVGKILSVGEQSLSWTENGLTNDDWIRVGNANDADSGYITDFDGTLVYVTGHCEDTGGNAKDIHLYINGVDEGSLGNLSGGSNATFINNTTDIDFGQGDRLRLRAVGVTGAIQDTVIKLTLKWRG